MLLSVEHLAEHFGKVSGRSLQESDSGSPARPVFVNIIYTGPQTTLPALRAADSLARDLRATVHIRAMISVPRQLAMEVALSSIQSLKRLIGDLVERVGSERREYVLHIYLCRSRLETLLQVLEPSSLLVIGGRRRIWPTAESRLSKAAVLAGHSVAFVHERAILAGIR